VAGAVWLLHAGLTGTGPADADAPVLAGFLGMRSPGLTAGVVALTTIGSTVAMALLATVSCGWLWWRGRRPEAVFVAVVAAGASAAFQLLKTVLGRARPPAVDRLVVETNESLPSGHATMSIAVVGALVVLAWAGCSLLARVWLVAVAALWVGAVGASRLYLGVHWFSDVLAGWLVGAAWLAVCAAGLVWWRHRPGDRDESHPGSGPSPAGSPRPRR
jgi:undecaprenyl-diphosphatase